MAFDSNRLTFAQDGENPVAKVAKTFGQLCVKRRAAETLGEFRYLAGCRLSALDLVCGYNDKLIAGVSFANEYGFHRSMGFVFSGAPS